MIAVIVWIIGAGIAAIILEQVIDTITLHIMRHKAHRQQRLIERRAERLRSELIDYEYRHGRPYEPRHMMMRPPEMPPDPLADHAEVDT